SLRQLGNRADHEGPASASPPQLSFVMFVVAGCSGPLPNAVPLPLARSSLPVSHHLLNLPEIQSGMENPHPQPIYTSCLTSPKVPLQSTSPTFEDYPACEIAEACMKLDALILLLSSAGFTQEAKNPISNVLREMLPSR